MTEALLAVGSASQLEFCTRAAAVEVLLSLAERAPAIVRKCPSVASGLLPLALALTCDVRKDFEDVSAEVLQGGRYMESDDQ